MVENVWTWWAWNSANQRANISVCHVSTRRPSLRLLNWWLYGRMRLLIQKLFVWVFTPKWASFHFASSSEAQNVPRIPVNNLLHCHSVLRVSVVLVTKGSASIASECITDYSLDYSFASSPVSSPLPSSIPLSPNDSIKDIFSLIQLGFLIFFVFAIFFYWLK